MIGLHGCLFCVFKYGTYHICTGTILFYPPYLLWYEFFAILGQDFIEDKRSLNFP